MHSCNIHTRITTETKNVWIAAHRKEDFNMRHVVWLCFPQAIKVDACNTVRCECDHEIHTLTCVVVVCGVAFIFVSLWIPAPRHIAIPIMIMDARFTPL